MPWTEKDLEARLRDAGVAFELIESPVDTPTVAAAAEALGVPPDRIVKSLLFADRDRPGTFVLVLARGTTRVDRERLARHAPGRWRMASADEVAAATGYAAGTVPPVAHATPVPVVMDARVHAMDDLIGGGGGHRHSVRLARRDVERLTRCLVRDVCDDPERPAGTA